MCSIFPCSVWCVHSGNTGKLWKYTRNQNLSSPRGGCRAGILTCFHLFKPVKVDSVCVCVCLCLRLCLCVFACLCLCVCVWYLSSCRHITGRCTGQQMILRFQGRGILPLHRKSVQIR